MQRQQGQATDAAGPSCAPGPSSHDKCITGGQTPHRKHLAGERKPSGKQVLLTAHSTVLSIVMSTRVVFSPWFTNGC